MGILAFLLLVILVGLVVWAAVRYVPMPPIFQQALPVLALVILIIVLLLALFGGVITDVKIPQVR